MLCYGTTLQLRRSLRLGPRRIRAMKASADKREISDALWFAAFVVAYAAAYRFGMPLARAAASPFWFPDAILLCAFLKSKPRNWWIFVVASLAVRFITPVPVGPPLW